MVDSSESELMTIVPRFDCSSTIVALSGTSVPQSVWAIIVPSPSSRPGTSVPQSSGNCFIVRELTSSSSESASWLLLLLLLFCSCLLA